MLKGVRDARLANRPFMTIDTRSTNSLPTSPTSTASMPAVSCPAPADLVVIEPERLDEGVEHIEETEMPGFPGRQRLVRRNDETVRAVMVNGRIAWRNGAADPSLGTSHDLGDGLARLAAGWAVGR